MQQYNAAQQPYGQYQGNQGLNPSAPAFTPGQNYAQPQNNYAQPPPTLRPPQQYGAHHQTTHFPPGHPQGYNQGYHQPGGYNQNGGFPQNAPVHQGYNNAQQGFGNPPPGLRPQNGAPPGLRPGYRPNPQQQYIPLDGQAPPRHRGQFLNSWKDQVLNKNSCVHLFSFSIVLVCRNKRKYLSKIRCKTKDHHFLSMNCLFIVSFEVIGKIKASAGNSWNENEISAD